jgi:hypothetical protein
MKKLDLFIRFIIFIKVCFIIFVITHSYLKKTGKLNSDLDKKAVYWKDRLEFIFKALMALLIIYLFNPRYKRETIIDYETKVLLFLFGFILLITADWSAFFKESEWFQKLQIILGKTNTN